MTEPNAGFFALTVDRPVATLMIVIALAVFGYLSWGLLPLTLLPELSYPTLTVRTAYPGAAPEEVEAEVARPVEEVLRTVEGVVDIESSSRPGLSDVVLRFHWDTNMDYASQRVRERVDVLRFPEEADRPLLLRYDPALDPILRIGLSGELPLAAQRRLAEEEVARELEKLPGVASVEVRGGREPLIHVDLDQDKLDRLGLRPDDIQQRLQSENINLAGGQLQHGQVQYLVRTLNEFTSVEELGEMTVAVQGGLPVPLSAVGRVYLDTKDRELATHIDGGEAVEIAIFKEADANIVQTADAVKARLFGEGGEAGGEGGASAEVEAEPKRPARRGARRGEKGGGGGPKVETPPLARGLPAGAKLTVLSDQSAYIEAAIDEVLQTALLGALLAIAILYVFLRSPWSTTIIAVAIPLSIVATFAPMRLMGTSLNLMSLGGLALGIGMLVDNSIVVLESIYRCRDEGDPPREAAIRGTREVGTAVGASTLTTIAVFLPLVFVEGIAGQIFTDLAMTVIFSLLASLAVSVLVVPMLAALQGRARSAADEAAPTERRAWWRFASLERAWADLRGAFTGVRSRPATALLLPLVVPWTLLRTLIHLVLELIFAKLLGPLLLGVSLVLAFVIKLVGRGLHYATLPVLWLFDRGFNAFTAAYLATLRGALRAPLPVLGAATLLFAGSIWALDQPGRELLPALHQGEFRAELQLPPGARIDDTEALVYRIERRLKGVEGIASTSSTIGAEAESVADADRGPHSATLHVRLQPGRDLQRDEAAAMERVREALDREPGLQYELHTPTLFSLQTPIQIELRGHNLRLLQQTARRLARTLEQDGRLSEVRTSALHGNPEVRITFDRARLASLGVELRQAAEAVRQKVQGITPSQMRQQAGAGSSDQRLDIHLRLDRDQLASLDDLHRLVVAHRPGEPGQNPIPITLDAVAEVQIVEGPTEIRHVDAQRAAIIEVEADSLDLQALAAVIDEHTARTPLPSGITLHIGGQNAELQQAQRSLLLALALAIFLVYVIMASQFESLVAPFVIIFSIPLAAVGVGFALLATATPLSVVVAIGLIVLAGIVVNNAIVLVDTVIHHRQLGKERHEAILHAGQIRLRPVLMTTLTTVLGLIPLALGLGEGAELRAPLAITVIAGLSTSTLLTLVVIPVLYDLVDRALTSLRRRPA